MKKSIILLLLLVPLLSKAQTIFLCLQPTDLGIGIRYDQAVSPKTGLYLSLTKGKYADSQDIIVSNHTKLSAGIVKYMKPEQKTQSFLSFGASYNHYTLQNIPEYPVHKSVTSPLSIEIGAGMIFMSHTTIAIRFDPVKWESSIDFGFKF